MNYANLRRLNEKLFFTVEDAADVLSVKRRSAWVLCSRYVKEGVFVRLKNNFYVTQERWERLSREEFFKIANYLQVPSYISVMTALAAYEVTTQVQRGYFESASLKRTGRIEAGGAQFNFYKLKKKYYFDFTRKDGLFIATKEKAFVDAAYLYSFGKYKVDFASLDLGKLDKERLKAIVKVYPEKTRKVVRRLCGI